MRNGSVTQSEDSKARLTGSRVKERFTWSVGTGSRVQKGTNKQTKTQKGRQGSKNKGGRITGHEG